MSALNHLAKISKHKLKLFQKEINSLRPELLSDKSVEEWMELSPDERKLKITVFLCMAMVPEEELAQIHRAINPRSEPFKKIGGGILVIFALILAFQVFLFYRADRVYLTSFQQEISFPDGSIKYYSLFDEKSVIVEKQRDGSELVMDDQFLDWASRRLLPMPLDSTKWTSDKSLSEEMEEFYREFNGNQSMSKKLMDVPLNPKIIYTAIRGYLGKRDIYMDLSVPDSLSTRLDPFIKKEDFEGSFFCSIRNASEFDNLKIDYDLNKNIIRVRPIYFPPRTPLNQAKVLWYSSVHIRDARFCVVNAAGKKINEYKFASFTNSSDSVATQ